MIKDNKVKHIAIIMDGNGRWANDRAHSRIFGHVRGAKNVSEIVETADDYGVEAITMYAFSTENWSRPQKEVTTLFAILKKFIIKEKKRIIRNNIKFKVIGDISGLPVKTQDLILDLEKETNNNTGIKLSFAFGYGGRQELVGAVNNFIKANPGKELSEQDIESNLLHPETGDVDLLIRTGGDFRISNFLLWQVAYAELFFTKTKWPDFKPQELIDILDSVSKRERRFGTVESCNSLEKSSNIAKENIKLYNQA